VPSSLENFIAKENLAIGTSGIETRHGAQPTGLSAFAQAGLPAPGSRQAGPSPPLSSSRLDKFIQTTFPKGGQPQMQDFASPRSLLNIPAQAVKGFVSEAAFGLPELGLKLAGQEELLETLEPVGTAERVAEIAGRFGGFAFGGPLKLAGKIVSKLATRVIGKSLSELVSRGIVEVVGNIPRLTRRGRAIQEGVTLGLASLLTGNERLAPLIDNPTFENAAEAAGERMLSGVLGAATGARFSLLRDTLDSFAARAAANLAISNATNFLLSGGKPDVENLVFNSLLDVWFSRNGRRPGPAEEGQIKQLSQMMAPEVETASRNLLAEGQRQKLLPAPRREFVTGEQARAGREFRVSPEGEARLATGEEAFQAREQRPLYEPQRERIGQLERTETRRDTQLRLPVRDLQTGVSPIKIEPERIEVERARVQELLDQGLSPEQARRRAIEETQLARMKELPADFGKTNQVVKKAEFNEAVARLRRRGICL
jgi:hypothetical protein